VSEPQRRKWVGYTFDGHYFPTKQEVVAAIQFLLHSQPLGEPLAPAHLQLMLSILIDHPTADSKIGCGVAGIEVRTNARFSNNTALFKSVECLVGQSENHNGRKTLVRR